MSASKLSTFRTAGVVAAALAVAVLVAVFLGSSGVNSDPATAACAPRVIVVDLSSADRSPELFNLALQVIVSAADSAAVCGDPLSAYGVAGGGQDTTILTSDDLTGLKPVGPNSRVRAGRFTASRRAAVAALVAARLAEAYHVGDPSITSISALYYLAAQQSAPNTTVTLLTTGVNQDSKLTLNQPLRTGQGAQLAKQISVPHVAAKEIVVVGIAQVDATTPPPSPQWPTEIWSFNQALCQASGAHCHLYTIAAPSQALGS